jgi:hypothetical protein
MLFGRGMGRRFISLWSRAVIFEHGKDKKGKAIPDRAMRAY